MQRAVLVLCRDEQCIPLVMCKSSRYAEYLNVVVIKGSSPKKMFLKEDVHECNPESTDLTLMKCSGSVLKFS